MNNFYPIFIEHINYNDFLISGICIIILYALIFGSQLMKKRPKGFSNTQVIFSIKYGKKTKVGFIILIILVITLIFVSQNTSLEVDKTGFTKTEIFGIKHRYNWNDFLSAKIKIGAVREVTGGGKYGGRSYCDPTQVFVGFWLYKEKDVTVLYEDNFYDVSPSELDSTDIPNFIYDLVYFSKLRNANITVTGPDNDDVANDCKSKGLTNPWDVQHAIEGILRVAEGKD